MIDPLSKNLAHHTPGLLYLSSSVVCVIPVRGREGVLLSGHGFGPRFHVWQLHLLRIFSWVSVGRLLAFRYTRPRLLSFRVFAQALVCLSPARYVTPIDEV